MKLKDMHLSGGVEMTRKEKHRLLAKLAGVPWEFQCPECSGTYFGTSNALSEDCVRHCHDRGLLKWCGWSGSTEECRRVPDYDKDHNAWVLIRLALDGKCLWDEFLAYWQSQGTFSWDYMKPREVYKFISDLPGQVDAAVEVMSNGG